MSMKHVEWHHRENPASAAFLQNYGASNMAIISQTALLHVCIIWSLLDLSCIRSLYDVAIAAIAGLYLFFFKINNRSFRYASLCPWNQLPDSVRLPLANQSVSIHLVSHMLVRHFQYHHFHNPSLSLSISNPNHFHCRLHEAVYGLIHLTHRTASADSVIVFRISYACRFSVIGLSHRKDVTFFSTIALAFLERFESFLYQWKRKWILRSLLT